MRRGVPQWPAFGHRLDRRVLGILHSGSVGAGAWVSRFEHAFADWSGAPCAVAVMNGTTALQAAFAALGIGPGDEVICTSYSFIASSFAIMLAGALPVFCDVGEDHMIDIAQAEKLVTKRTKAVLVVHLYGIVADMDPIMRFAKRHRLRVVEDCAQCLGGVYKGRKVGTIGDVGCFSFCQTKHITTGGEGGLALTADPAVGERLRIFRARTGARLTEIQAAIGLEALSRLERWNLPRRRMLGRALIAGLKNHPLVRVVPPDTPERANAFWLVPFVLRREFLSVSGLDFARALQRRGVGAYAILWPEMYREQAYQKRRGFGPNNSPFDDPRSRFIDYSKVICPVAHSLTDAVVGFWTHPTYTLADIHADIRAFESVAAEFSKSAT